MIAATNRPQDLDIALRRPGRFDWEIEFPYPNELDRQDILEKTARTLTVGTSLPHGEIARMSSGWSGAELAQVWTEAALLAVKDKRMRILEEDYIGGFERVSRHRMRVGLPQRGETRNEALFRSVQLVASSATRGDGSARADLVREFIYLDDISVYSILASRKGSIATEFTEDQTVSLNNDAGTSIGIGLDTTNARFSSGLQSSHVHGSQVLRKAIVQTSFKELYEIEYKSLRLGTLSGRHAPNATSVADIDRRFGQLCKDGWIIDVSSLNRGDLFEAEVELEADPIFRMTSIITTLRDLIANNQGMLGKDVTENLPAMQSMAQVLDSLLVGLVPIRGV